MSETKYSVEIGQLNSIPRLVVILTFIGIAWFNGLEMILMTWMTFKKRSAYFYSLIVCCLGILCYESAIFCLIFAKGINAYGLNAAINTGWTCMVTGQSMVLWSRLHLVCSRRIVLRAVLAMIVIDGALCHSTQWISSFLAIQGGITNLNYSMFKYGEKVTLSVFFIQEVIISAIYMIEATKVLRKTAVLKEPNHQHERMRNLFLANIVILVLDASLLALEFAAIWGVWNTFKGFAYSVKVKVEFVILNELRSSAVKSGGRLEYEDHPSRFSQRDTVRFPSIGSDTKDGDVQLSMRGVEAHPIVPLAGGEDGSTLSDSRKNITVTTEFAVASESRSGSDGTIARQPFRKSISSSEIDFASRGA